MTTDPQIPQQKDLLPISAHAAAFHKEIVAKLLSLESLSVKSCLDSAFTEKFSEILHQYENYQQMILNHSAMKITCHKGCSFCCSHWVEDVNSFEVELIVDYIKKTFPQKKIQDIVRMCKNDQKELERLEKIVIEKIDTCDDYPEDEDIDYTDMLLSVFYQMKRPCPLLDSKGGCMVYHLRPLTCRIYLSFSDPLHCSPEYINDNDIPTYLLNLEEEASEILDRLHFKYQKFPDDTGLRSLLLKYLQIGSDQRNSLK